MATKFPKIQWFTMHDSDIINGRGCDPNKCAIKLAVKRGIGGHGYVSVDCSGISVTRRADRREKAFLPRNLRHWLISFDRWRNDPSNFERPTAIRFRLEFFKTSMIVHRDQERVNANRHARKAAGKPDKKYNLRKRVEGLAIAEPAL